MGRPTCRAEGVFFLAAVETRAPRIPFTLRDRTTTITLDVLGQRPRPLDRSHTQPRSPAPPAQSSSTSGTCSISVAAAVCPGRYTPALHEYAYAGRNPRQIKISEAR
jgi:hypothetical protein